MWLKMSKELSQLNKAENKSADQVFDRRKRNVLRRCLNIASDVNADVTCDGRLFQKLVPETGKPHLPTVERLKGSTASFHDLFIAGLWLSLQ